MTAATTSNPTPAASSGAGSVSPSPQLAALLNGAGIAPLDNTGWIRVTGEDRVRWLNGMATNAIQQLPPGAGNYNFFLNAQGRIQGDAYIFLTPEALLIETSHPQVSSLIPYLDHYIIMDDVELADVTSSRHGFTLIGPQAADLLGQIGLSSDGLEELHIQTLPLNSSSVTLIHGYSPLVPRFEIWTTSAESAASILESLRSAGAIPSDSASLESLRILEGTPLYGVDIRDRDLPQETNQTRALHFAKGCYLGQEIVERIRSRGSVHRTFTAFRIEGAPPSPGTPLETQSKQVGELTSIASIPLSGESLQLALGYIRREALDRNEPLLYSGGAAVPVPMPYPAAQTRQQASDSSAS